MIDDERIGPMAIFGSCKSRGLLNHKETTSSQVNDDLPHFPSQDEHLPYDVTKNVCLFLRIEPKRTSKIEQPRPSYELAGSSLKSRHATIGRSLHR